MFYRSVGCLSLTGCRTADGAHSTAASVVWTRGGCWRSSMLGCIVYSGLQTFSSFTLQVLPPRAAPPPPCPRPPPSPPFTRRLILRCRAVPCTSARSTNKQNLSDGGGCRPQLRSPHAAPSVAISSAWLEHSAACPPPATHPAELNLIWRHRRDHSQRLAWLASVEDGALPPVLTLRRRRQRMVMRRSRRGRGEEDEEEEEL